MGLDFWTYSMSEKKSFPFLYSEYTYKIRQDCLDMHLIVCQRSLNQIYIVTCYIKRVIDSILLGQAVNMNFYTVFCLSERKERKLYCDKIHNSGNLLPIQEVFTLFIQLGTIQNGP